MNIKNIQNFVWIFQKDRKNDGEIAEVYTDFVEDITCLINPQLYEGWYDPEEEYANQTIARFYGKQAVYVYYNQGTQ